MLDKLYREIDFSDLEESSYDQSSIQECNENFCRTNMAIDFPSVFNKLYIVSTYQAILLDEKDEIFEYKFSNYRKYMNIIRVQAALKNDLQTVDALKMYWTRKINDHWCANIGRYELRRKFRELENFSDTLLMKDILICVEPTDMEDWLEIYIHDLAPIIINTLKSLPLTPEVLKMLKPYFQLLKLDDYFEDFE